MTKAKPTKAPPGPPAALVSRIEHLAALLKNLPTSIPLDPPQSTYQFTMDPEKLEDCGVFGAFSSCMEICFGTWQGKDRVIHFTERGKRLAGLTALMKTAVKTMSEGEREVFREAWLERLIKIAIADGAKISAKKRKQAGSADFSGSGGGETQLSQSIRRLSVSREGVVPAKRAKSAMSAEVIEMDDDSESDDDLPECLGTLAPHPSPKPSLPAPPPLPLSLNLRQGTLDAHLKSFTSEDRQFYMKQNAEKHQEAMETMNQKEKRKREKKMLHERELARERQRRRRARQRAEKELEDDSDTNERLLATDVLMQGAKDAQSPAIRPEDVP
ncbi:hypothetical protein H0H81_008123, partial [Sphagnurus paluster]